jgi:biopolymer transport protein ExbD/biopolymer transport protein ExbB/TolQ
LDTALRLFGAGGIVMIPLLICSIFALAVVIEKLHALRARKVIAPAVVELVGSLRTNEDMTALAGVCRRIDTPFARVIRTGLENADLPRAENVELIQSSARHEVGSLERGLTILEIITGISPLLGLLGTVLGMFHVFNVIVEGSVHRHSLAGGAQLFLQAGGRPHARDRAPRKQPGSQALRRQAAGQGRLGGKERVCRVRAAMNIREKKRKRPVINITSLIDVMFLLLVFFMVSTTFAEHPGIKLELPSASTAEPTKLERLTLAIDKKGRMFLNDVPVDDKQLRSMLEEAAAKPDATLVLKADKGVPYGYVINAMDISRQSGIRRIVSLTETPRPAR